MRKEIVLGFAAALTATGASQLAAATTEPIKNDKVIVTQTTLVPGERETLAGKHASLVVYLAGEKAEVRLDGGTVEHESIVRGETVREAAKPGVLVNTGAVPLKLVRVEFITAGSNAAWGRAGLAPTYEMLYDDQHCRAYTIRIAPHAWEPMHTHRARVVVGLDGAHIEHVLPDGSVHPTDLKSDDVAWRTEETHKGHNLSDTALWVIAIEPK